MAAARPYGFKSILLQTLFLDQLHDSSLLSLNSFFTAIYGIKISKKILDIKIISFSKAKFHESTYARKYTCFNQENYSQVEIIFVLV